jgi:hypothetical protein
MKLVGAPLLWEHVHHERHAERGIVDRVDHTARRERLVNGHRSWCVAPVASRGT